MACTPSFVPHGSCLNGSRRGTKPHDKDNEKYLCREIFSNLFDVLSADGWSLCVGCASPLKGGTTWG